MSKENVLVKTVDSRKIKELVKNYIIEMGHTFNANCCNVDIKCDGNVPTAYVDVNDPKNPAKKKISIKISEAIEIIAKKKGISLSENEIEIDKY